MHLNRSTLAFLATLLLASSLVWWVISRVDQQATSSAGPSVWQHADTPPSGISLEDPWLSLTDAWTEAAVPVAKAIGPVIMAGSAAEVIAVADGIVLFAGIRAGAHAVILGHRDASGTRFESIYAPLSEMTRKPGELVGRGMIIGKIDEQALGPVLREAPANIEQVDGGKSPLAEAIESPDAEAWMTLEIGNAEKMLQLMKDPQD